MITLVKAVQLRALAGHRLWVRFSDGSEGVRSFADIIAEGGVMVEPLRDQAFFEQAFIAFGVPTWPNGFDVDAINLRVDIENNGGLSRPKVALDA